MSEESKVRREILDSIFDKSTPEPTFGSGRSMTAWVDAEVARRMAAKKKPAKKKASKKK